MPGSNIRAFAVLDRSLVLFTTVFSSADQLQRVEGVQFAQAKPSGGSKVKKPNPPVVKRKPSPDGADAVTQGQRGDAFARQMRKAPPLAPVGVSGWRISV
jgi:hypothetical protein